MTAPSGPPRSHVSRQHAARLPDAADGENLFLSAYRFDRSLPQVYRATIPYVLILAVTILLITYLPWMTLAPLELMGWRPD